jgi:PadR family transcriptional regulator, regulatory protein PadR
VQRIRAVEVAGPVIDARYALRPVDSQWEERSPDAGGRPPRKYYRLTAEGVRAARLELAAAAAPPGRTRQAAARSTPGTAGSAL